MEKQSYAKISKWISWALMLISIAVVVWGTVVGYPKAIAADNGTVDPLLYWTYLMVLFALGAVILVGLYITIRTDAKKLVKMGIILVGVVVVCLIAYLLASGAPAIGYNGTKIPTPRTLKQTDTVLNLAYFCGGAAILSIIVGEIMAVVRNKKA